MQKIVGVRRSDDKNIYYFLQEEDLENGDKIVADFDEFQTIATVCRPGVKVDKDKASELKSILRKATDADLKKYNSLKEKAGLPPNYFSRTLEAYKFDALSIEE